MFHLSIKGYCKTHPHRSCCFLSMFTLRCKRHYRNLATYSWCTTWREHVTKTAPARRRHSVVGGGGGAPISYDRRRQRRQNVGGAAAAAHSSSLKSQSARDDKAVACLHISGEVAIWKKIHPVSWLDLGTIQNMTVDDSGTQNVLQICQTKNVYKVGWLRINPRQSGPKISPYGKLLIYGIKPASKVR